MRQQLAEVRAIDANTAAPTFDNTIGALERSGRMLERAALPFYAVAQANSNDTLQAAETALAPKFAAHGDAINLDPKLFARVKALNDGRAGLGPDPRTGDGPDADLSEHGARRRGAVAGRQDGPLRP